MQSIGLCATASCPINQNITEYQNHGTIQETLSRQPIMFRAPSHVPFVLLIPTLVYSWQGIKQFCFHEPLLGNKKPSLRASSSVVAESDANHAVVAKAAIACGFSSQEVPMLESIVRESCDDMGLACTFDELQLQTKVESSKYHGLTGRILVLAFPGQVDQTILSDLNDAIAERVDMDLYSHAPNLDDPFLLRFEHEDDCVDLEMTSKLDNVVHEVELCVPLPSLTKEQSAVLFLPSQVVEVDGAYIQEPENDIESWDTSTVAVFDGLVSHDLRKRLAQAVGGGNDLSGNTGPDLERWEKGGLSDRLDDDPSTATYGLTYEAIQDICFNDHDAIREMECIISELFSDFTVVRLPEAVFGESVSPLTANAPVAGDVFDYHIDGDPNLTPPSIWTDVYGRYPNRSGGKPRFVSFLIYLNDEWQEEWGGPTRFLDVATDTTYSVTPKPGRCVCMDQDVTHSVTAPSKAAGKRPRYSLVWKLILHPKHRGQDMRNLACGRKWPKSKLIGSAKGPDLF